jgi:mono/diheme cytochrome c family protein
VQGDEDTVNARWKVIGVALMFLCTAGTASAQSADSPTGDPAAGAQLFRTRGCAECHGSDMARLQQHRSLYALAAAMWNHFPLMADRIRASQSMTHPYLTSGEMRDLVAFLSSANPEGPTRTQPDGTGPTGDAKRGEQLVSDKGCLRCHSLAGPGGGTPGGSLDRLKGWDSPWSVVAQMWNHSFRMEFEVEDRRAGWAPLNPDEMADLVAFLQALMLAR